MAKARVMVDDHGDEHTTMRWLAVMVAVLVVALPALWATPAQAASTTQCSGFSDCAAKGKSDAGYGLVHGLSFWNMRPGHNCTNYVAYRLTHGRLVARPPGTGDAGSWAAAARSKGIPVDGVPKVGAVAWWAADKVKAPYSGHVAYVEKVRSDGSVEISEDNLDGTFRWRHVTRGAGWPSGFIHYPASDGSPVGNFDSVSVNASGQLDFWGTSSDPDAGLLAPSYLVTLGGPRGTAGVESFTFSTPYFSFHRVKTVKTRGATTMYLYALNTPLTQGRDVLLGSRAVTIRDASSVQASFADATITAATTPKVNVTLSPAAASGTIDVKRGSTVLKSITVASGGKRTVTVSLPKQAKGSHTVTVSYRGSDKHLPSSKGLTLTVR